MTKTNDNETNENMNQYNIDYIYNALGSVNFGSTVLPSANNAYSLGASSFFWETGYISSLSTAQFIVPSSGALTLKNHLLPDVDNAWDLGGSSKRIRNLYVSNLLFSQISGNTFTSTVGPLLLTTPTINDPVQINRDLVPSTNNTYRVGTNALKWLAVYGSTIFSNSIDGGGQPILFNGSLRPSGTFFFLGSPSQTWSQGHINTLFNTTLNTRTISANTSGDLILTTSSAGNVISVDRHIVPVGSGLTNLGSSTNRYATVFSNAVDVPTLAANTISSTTGNLLITTPNNTDLITVDRDLVPSVDEGENLGVAGQRWLNIRGANVVTNLIGNGASTLSFDSSVAPLVDLTKSIGTPSNRFLDANIGTVNSSTTAANTLTTLTHQDLLITTANPTHKITLTRSILPTVDGTQDLGAAAAKFNNLYCNVINAPAFNVDTISTATTTDLTLTTQSSSHAVITPRNFNPTVNNTQTLGTTALRWNQAYATTVFTGTVSNSGSPMLFNGSIRPSSDNTFNLGTNGLRFSQGFVRQMYSDSVVETPTLRAGTALDLNLTTLTAGNSIVAQRNVLPNANNTLNLGSSSVRWATVFATSINVTTLAINSLSSATGNLTLTTPLNSENIIMDRVTLPSLDNTYSLGSVSNRWLAVYAPTLFTTTINTGVGDLTVTGNIVPSLDNSLSLGLSTQRFSAAHVTTLNSTTVNTPTLQSPTTTDLTLTTVTAGNKIVTARNILPSSDNTLDLGALSARFANIYVTNLNASSYNANTISSVTGNLLLSTPLVGDTVTTNRNFTPTVTNSQNLGTSSLSWANIYGTTGFFNTISNNNNPIITAGGLQPNNDNQHWIGDITKRYQRAYIINSFTDTIASTGTNNLLLTTPISSQVITTDRNLQPTVTNSLTIGNTTVRWANVHSQVINTETIESPANTDLILNCASGVTYSIRSKTHFIPDQSNLYNLGSSTLLWNNGYFNNAFTNTLRGATGVITTYNSLTPVSNNNHNLGSSSLRYNTLHASNINTQTFANQSGTSISVSTDLLPNGSRNIGTNSFPWNTIFTNSLSVLGDLLPPANNFYNLGSSLFIWASGFFNTVRTNNLESILASVITLATNLIPSSNQTISLGSSSNQFLNFFTKNITVNLADYVADITYGPLTLSAGGLAKIDIGVLPGPYDAGNNRIKFPTKGLYVIQLNIAADVDTSFFNEVEIRLFRANLVNYVGNGHYYTVGITNTSPFVNIPAQNYTATWNYYCGSTDDRLEIHCKRFMTNVTNFRFLEGSRVYKIVGTQ